jgi:threonine/homoserine/homoserine lactone efflux protein
VRAVPLDLPGLPLLAGIALGVSLAAPPGPVLALMLEELAQRGRWASLQVGLGALTADMGFAVLALAGAITVLAQRPVLLGAVSIVGAGLLAYYAWSAWRAARRQAGAATGRRATYATGFLTAATSPFNWAWWVGPGTALLANEGPWLAAGMLIGILAWLGVFVEGMARVGRRAPRFQAYAAWASALILAAFALLVAWRGLGLLGRWA